MYILDANALIGPSNHHYGLDFCPAYWEWLERACRGGLAISISAVRDEIKREDTREQRDLLRWCRGQGRGLFRQTEGTADHLLQVAELVRGSGAYANTALRGFVNGTDHILVAEALARGAAVVSYEVSNHPGLATPDSRRSSVKLPDVCEMAGLEFLRPYEMLRRAAARFGLLEDGFPQFALQS